MADGDLSLDRAMEHDLGLEGAAKNARAIQGVCLLGVDESDPNEVNKIVSKQQSAEGSDPCYRWRGSRHSPASTRQQGALTVERLGIWPVCHLGNIPKQSTRSAQQVTERSEKAVDHDRMNFQNGQHSLLLFSKVKRKLLVYVTH